jgi:hypothetical protein
MVTLTITNGQNYRIHFFCGEMADLGIVTVAAANQRPLGWISFNL